MSNRLLQINIDNKEYFDRWMPLKPDASLLFFARTVR